MISLIKYKESLNSSLLFLAVLKTESILHLTQAKKSNIIDYSECKSAINRRLAIIV
jgi:hypothetical protein